jgi:hypothetical protein
MANINKDISDLSPVLKQILTLKSFKGGPSYKYKQQLAAANPELFQQLYGARYARWKLHIDEVEKFKDKCRSVMDLCQQELLARKNDPSLIPTYEDPIGILADSTISGAPIVDPNIPTDSVFDLVFGPPKSSNGFYMLTSDGLYYDAQKGGLDPIYLYLSGLDYPKVGDLWKFEHAPNMGGRGDTLSIQGIDAWNNTLFDPDFIDESLNMQPHYDADHFLQTLITSKSKHIFDLSAQAGTAAGDLATQTNLKQAIQAEIEKWEHNVKLRKKQIEIAVKAFDLYAPPPPASPPAPDIAAKGFYGGPGDTVPPASSGNWSIPGSTASNIPPSTGASGVLPAFGDAEGYVDPSKLPKKATISPFKLGHVPVNDFSYLHQINFVVDVSKQKHLLIKSADVEGIVLPAKAKFVQLPVGADYFPPTHLYVPPMGVGGIIYTPQNDVDPTVLSLNDQIETQDLFCIYNYLDGRSVLNGVDASNVLNCATVDMYNSAKACAATPSAIFADGLGTPYLKGTAGISTEYFTLSPGGATIGHLVSGLGAFIQTPDTKEFRELTYNPKGFTFETWAHVPFLTSGLEGWASGTGASALTKCILACENTGLASNVATSDYDPLDPDKTGITIDTLTYSEDSWRTRGMIMGFTRDRRITQNDVGYSNVDADNEITASGVCFFVAPTISKDLSSCSWVNDGTSPSSVPNFHKIAIQASSVGAHGKKFGDVSGAYMLIDVAVSPEKNKIFIYLDGELMGEQSLSETFGIAPGKTLNLPSFIQNNSFNYTKAKVGLAPEAVYNGPKTSQFTPWLLGGGFTDGMTLYGNFMGEGLGETPGSVGGYSSGLRGYLGSTKFYSACLTKEQINNNYKAQQGFFKTINVSNKILGVGYPNNS